MKKRVTDLAIALGCLIGFIIVFTEITEFDSFWRRSPLRAAPLQLKERLRPWRAPLVINSSPEQGQRDVLPRSPITLTFLTPMNPSTVERNVSFEPRTAGQFSWQDERTLVFTPAQPWPAGTRITMKVSRGARSWLLRRMEEPFGLDFTILASPIVVNTEPSRQVQFAHDLSQITITFSHFMDEASVESHLSIEPQIQDLELAWTKENLAISGALRTGTTYRVNITKGAQDAAYGLSMAKDFGWTFTVVERQPGLAVTGPGRVTMMEAEAPFQLPFTIMNLSRIDLALYALDGPTFVALQNLPAEDWEQHRPEGNPIREWTVSSQAEADQEILQKIEIDPTPPGLYLLAANSPEGAHISQLLSVSRSALILKRAPEQVLVWAVSLADGSPAADYVVTIYEKGGQVLATGRTDREGVFKGSLPQKAGPLLAIAQREDDVAACAEEWSAFTPGAVEGLSDDRVYAYTDRPIHYPGQEVHFKAIVRHDDDGRYSLRPAGTMVPVVVTDEAGRVVYQETLQLTPFGSISGSFPLSEEAPSGRYRLVVNTGGEEHESHFQVERPHRPGYAVSVTTDRPSYVRGDVITATVSASYGFEIPVSRAEVSYTLYAANYPPQDVSKVSLSSLQAQRSNLSRSQIAPAGFAIQRPSGGLQIRREQKCDLLNLPCSEAYEIASSLSLLAMTKAPVGFTARTLEKLCYLLCLPGNDFGDVGQEEADGEKQTVASGRGVTDDAGRFTVALPTRVASSASRQLGTLEVTVTAPSQQPVNASTSFPIHQSSFYIVLRPEQRVARVGQEVIFDVQTMDTEGQSWGHVRLTYTFHLIEWHREGDRGAWEETSTEVARGDLRTDGQGQAQIDFKPTTGGMYRLRIKGEDGRGNRITNSTPLWVSEAEHKIGWRWPEGDQVELVTDKVNYRVGEVAKVMVLSPYRQATALLTVERGRVMTYRAVELEGYSDTVSVPIESDYFPNAFVSVILISNHHPDSHLPGFKIGYAELTVESAEKDLTVYLSLEKERYRPGERVVCNVRTADGEGQPLSAEVSMAIVDAASSETPGIIEAFYGRRGLAVRTAESLAVHLDREKLAGDIENPVPESASQLQTEVSNLQSFPGMIYWNPAIVTDKDGRASVSFRLPDKLMTWRILAQGVTVDTRVGAAVADFVVSQDLTARLALPPFWRMGDDPTVEALLYNRTDKPLETAVTLMATGLELQDPLSRTVVISAGHMVRVDWPATVPQESTAAMALSAVSEAIADEVEIAVPILPFGDEGGLTDAGGVEDEITLTVSVPKNAITTALTIKGFPSLLALTVDSLDYLRDYPYGNTEQTASWLLAAASVRQVLGKHDREDKALSQKLAQQGQAALWRLYRFQDDDGGWGWWEDSRPSPYFTAQVVHSLLLAQKAGLPVDEIVLERGVRALQNDLKDANDPDLEAYLLYVLTEAGEGSPARADSLLDHRAELAPWARVYLVMTMHALGKADEASGIAADLSEEAKVTVGTAHWQQGQLAGEAMASEISTTALALQALLQVDPDSPLIPKAIDWLIRVQQDGHWRTPRETATVVAALTDYLVIKGEKTPDHRYQVLVNGRIVGSGLSTRENMAVPVKFVVTELEAGDNKVRLIKEGKERLHYALTLHHYWSQENMEPTRALGGPSLYREYFDPVTGGPKTEYRVGDLIGVRLTVEVPEEMWYVTAEDPLPAGVEAIEGSLKAESGQGGSAHLASKEDKVALFVQRLETGKHVYRYLVRATVSGRFRSTPASVYPLYEPNLWGRSASESLQVESLTFTPK